ncbi:hypothetical protein MBLNU230_g5517t1 [Neophaeotheca triangularis]
MESSRIFVKGLPPSFSDVEFRKHFAFQGREITDAKLFPRRRIGYVGYKTPEDAHKAVKYFNKSFIRMSRIGVEIARPIEDAKIGKAPTAQKAATSTNQTVLGDRHIAGERGEKRKRGSEGKEEVDPKLKEFLEVMKSKGKKNAWENQDVAGTGAESVSKAAEQALEVQEGGSDDEYEVVPKKAKRAKESSPNEAQINQSETAQPVEAQATHEDKTENTQEGVAQQPAASDNDWMRSRTSRLLGLLDEDEEDAVTSGPNGREVGSDTSDSEDVPKHRTAERTPEPAAMPTPPSEDVPEKDDGKPDNESSEAVRSSMRLFLRNLPYDVKREDIESEFGRYGNIEEVHIPLDTRTGDPKGFAYLQFSDSDAAERAIGDKDGQPFQGRLLHILPASAKRENKLDDFALSKLPLKKQQQIKKRREAASTTFNWNALYMNADAVVSSVADRLGLQKSEVLDPTSSDTAVKQAHAETHIIQETKSYFKQQGVDLDAFKKSQRGDTAILVKNIPYDCSRDELKRLFEEHGELKHFLVPPSAVIAVVEYANAAQCKAAFGALAYRKIKSSVLFLEKAPKALFSATGAATDDDATNADGVNKVSALDLKDADYNVADTAGTATLFVRNLNFTTTSATLNEVFKPLDGFLSARVKTKTDPKKPGQVLSMGFGFLEFRSAPQAQAALQALDGHVLEGHKLQLRASHKGADAAEDRRKADAAKKQAAKKTKVVIKNLPFEATKKDIRNLFGAYGQLRSVRLPQKMGRGTRGFAFADFTTPKEAENAMDALRDTHILGRRLVLDFASEEAEDAEAEIEKMQAKVGGQVNKVALQNLTGGGRKKFTTEDDEAS